MQAQGNYWLLCGNQSIKQLSDPIFKSRRPTGFVDIRLPDKGMVCRLCKVMWDKVRRIGSIASFLCGTCPPYRAVSHTAEERLYSGCMTKPRKTFTRVSAQRVPQLPPATDPQTPAPDLKGPKLLTSSLICSARQYNVPFGSTILCIGSEDLPPQLLPLTPSTGDKEVSYQTTCSNALVSCPHTFTLFQTPSAAQ